MYNCRKREKQDEPLWVSLSNTVVAPEAPALGPCLGHCRRVVCTVPRSAVVLILRTGVTVQRSKSVDVFLLPRSQLWGGLRHDACTLL